jgi:mono/diheme cytochrome c family protein
MTKKYFRSRAAGWAVLTGGAVLLLSSMAAAQGDAHRGAELASMWCNKCHATATGGDAPDVGPPFTAIAQKRDADYLRTFLADPHGPMKGIELPRQEIEDLVSYITHLPDN